MRNRIHGAGRLRLRRTAGDRLVTIGAHRFRIAAGRRRRLTDAGLRMRAVARTSGAASASLSARRFVRLLPPREG
jgi:hypothetical protein